MTPSSFFVTFVEAMKNAGYTKQERSFIVLMRVIAVLFFGGAVIFALAPDYIPNYLTNAGVGLFNWDTPPLVLEGTRFWLVMAVSFLLALSYICLIAQRNLVRNIGYVRPVILAEFASCAGFLLCFIFGGRQFAHLAAAVFNGFVCFIVWRSYAQALKSRV